MNAYTYCQNSIISRISYAFVSIFFFLTLSIHTSAQSGKNVYNILDYGATGNKSDLVTEAIQSAIDAANEAGGGHIYFPPGDHLSGTIKLKSNVTLYLESGATLWASRDSSDYELVPYTTTHDKIPVLIHAENVEHIAIRGKGRIHGQAEREQKLDKDPVYQFAKDEIQNAIDSGVEMKRYYKVPPYVTLILLSKSKYITVEDITLKESSFWTLHMHRCDTAFIRGIQVYSNMDTGVNADGIGIDSSRNVTISDVIVETGDDSIVLKTTQASEGNFPLENITVTNCKVSSTSAGLKLGTESYSDFRNIHFNNCVVRNTNRALNIVVRDGATVQDVTFSNITIETNRKEWFWWGNGDPIWVVLLKRNEDSELGEIKDVVFENIIARGQGTSKIEGYRPTEEYPEGRNLENISLRNISLHMQPEDKKDKRATHALAANHVSNLKLENITIDWQTKETEPMWKSAISLSEIDRMRLSGFDGRQGLKDSDEPVIHIKNVRNAIIEDIEAFEGANTLLKIQGKKTENVILDKINRLNQAEHSASINENVNSNAVIRDDLPVTE